MRSIWSENSNSITFNWTIFIFSNINSWAVLVDDAVASLISTHRSMLQMHIMFNSLIFRHVDMLLSISFGWSVYTKASLLIYYTYIFAFCFGTTESLPSIYPLAMNKQIEICLGYSAEKRIFKNNHVSPMLESILPIYIYIYRMQMEYKFENTSSKSVQPAEHYSSRLRLCVCCFCFLQNLQPQSHYHLPLRLA